MLLYPSWQIDNVGGLDDGSVVSVIELAFLANPTHSSFAFVEIFGELNDISFIFFTFVS